ncbi:glycosyltransferase family 4 protein [Haladaptatus sp. NG-WS-4]
MKIGLDARTLVGNISGVGNYLANIIESGAFAGHTLYAYYDDRANESPASIETPESTTLIWRPIRSPRFVDDLLGPAAPAWWVNVTLLRALKEDRIGAFFGPNFVQPILFDGPSAIIVHDMIHRTYPDAHPRLYRLYLQAFLGRAVKKADQIITVSSHSEQDLQKYRDVQPERISVAPGAANERYRPRELSSNTRERLREEYDLPDQFLLYVGNIEPRKNLVTVIEALSLLNEEERPPLVIVGKEQLADETFKTAYQQCRFKDQITFTGYVAEEDLPLLYNMARIFVFPSLYEGFGLPVLEAIQSGTPVITSNTSSLPEVVGDAAVTVDPQDVSSISQEISELWTNEHARDEYRELGYERATEFSWQQTAKKIAETWDSMF